MSKILEVNDELEISGGSALYYSSPPKPLKNECFFSPVPTVSRIFPTPWGFGVSQRSWPSPHSDRYLTAGKHRKAVEIFVKIAALDSLIEVQPTGERESLYVKEKKHGLLASPQDLGLSEPPSEWPNSMAYKWG